MSFPNHTILVIACGGFLAMGPRLLSAADELRHVNVFVSGQDGYHTYRIPSLLPTPQGTLLAFCEGRKTGRGDHGDLDLLLKRSADGGETWSGQQVVYEEGGNARTTIGNPCPVVDQHTGTIWLPFCRDNDKVFVTSSDDDGRSWSAPRDITHNVKRPGWGWYATGPGVGIQLTRGDHRGRLVIPCDHREQLDGRSVKMSHVFYSDDHGATWRLGGSVAPHTDECQVVELPNGQLLINMRNYWASEGGVASRGGKRAVAISSDGGNSWGELRFDEKLIEPICQAGMIRCSWPNEGRSRIVFSNPASSQSRQRMTVRISYDEGRTWPVSKLIWPASAAYSCPARLSDGRVGLLYERDDYKTIAFTAFSAD